MSWTDVSDGVQGFGYLTRGTQRHRVLGRTLSNVVAWGDDTDRIGNRAESVPRPWPKAFDQRLRGTHLIEYALLPHEGAWVESGIVSEARSWNAPPFALETGRHDGVLPDALNALSVGPAAIVPTAVLPAPGRGARTDLRSLGQPDAAGDHRRTPAPLRARGAGRYARRGNGSVPHRGRPLCGRLSPSAHRRPQRSPRRERFPGPLPGGHPCRIVPT